MAMQLSQALDLRRGDMAALIGAGGKTTTMFRLVKELREKSRKVLVTTTTKIFKPSKPHVDRLFLVDNVDALAQACSATTAPVVPASCQLTIWLMSIDVLNKPRDGAWVHRAERALALLPRTAGELITEDFIVQLVQHPAGCWKGIPAASRKVAVINQVDAPEDLVPAIALGKKLLAYGADRVVITSYLSEDPVRELLLH